MLSTTLQFKSVYKLWKFKTRIHAYDVLVNAAQKLLICELSKNDVMLACRFYGATVLPKAVIPHG